MKAAIIAILVAGAGFGVWKLLTRGPATITEEQAQKLAETKLLEFTNGGEFKSLFLDFKLQPRQPPADARFQWAFLYENVAVSPAHRVLISVGKTADHALEFTTFEPPPPPEPTWTEQTVASPASAPETAPVQASEPIAAPGQEIAPPGQDIGPPGQEIGGG